MPQQIQALVNSLPATEVNNSIQNNHFLQDTQMHGSVVGNVCQEFALSRMLYSMTIAHRREVLPPG